MESYLRQFLSIDEPAAPVRERVDMAMLLEEVLQLVRPSCRHAGIDLAFSAPPQPMFLRGDPEALRQLATNLVLNAAEAAVTGPVQPPCIQVELAATGRGGSLCVWDTGPGPHPKSMTNCSSRSSPRSPTALGSACSSPGILPSGTAGGSNGGEKKI